MILGWPGRNEIHRWIRWAVRGHLGWAWLLQPNNVPAGAWVSLEPATVEA